MKQEWTGSFLKRVGLTSLGLVVQLGHTPGAACTAMRRGKFKFTLIDVTGIHNVALLRVCWWPMTVCDPSTCATFNVIRLFQNMNCLGKISAFHFLRSLELLTNADRLAPLPRAGRGHADTGVGRTAQGELALACQACPQLGKNLPEDWEKIDWPLLPENLSYKYFLILAEDCNFRLINCDMSSEVHVPIIDDGLGYFCNHVKYKNFLCQHVDEEEISTCSRFQAMFLANTKRVGGVTCAWHNMWHSNGLDDLQVGERYSNMMFILFFAILNVMLLYLILSYDIACQFSKNYWSRMEGLPAEMHINVEKVPNFHILGHKWPLGMTDGEDVEQNWEFTNGAAGLTKMMGPDGHHAFLEGLFVFHNWMRTVSYRKVFVRQMARNLKEGKQHKEAFDAFTALVEGERPELVIKWRKWVKDWESVQHTDGYNSPFEIAKPVHTMKDICLRLGKEELMRTGASRSFGDVLMMSCRRILTIDMKALANPTALQELDFMKRKTALLKHINRFRKLQRTFLTAGQREIRNNKTRGPEAVKLFMPSELGTTSRAKTCEKGLDGIEEELREGELKETLEELRQALRTQTMTNHFQHRNTTGQRALTRAQGVLRQISIRIHKAKLRYLYARNALLRLRGHGNWEKTYRMLEDADKLGEIVKGGIAAAGVVAAGEGTHTMSCIWYSTNVATGKEELIDVLRVEWCKVYARMHRWHEDIVLVEEEMRCTIEYGAWMAAQWEMRATARTSNTNPALAEGLRAICYRYPPRNAADMLPGT
ncbi:hypothetical protein DFH08DRAFT_911760 [Mycena albidolilacea]|uniref:CxC2-like cysteine cluster KDZ transposase-associated domain-containing protein n=1 Tax=Mycena albidolilacea TaxID=1033008 RepID=A0AAD7AH92_9AGAR|nr:hypothetical protein DFH08DRAFT_911760 [Mycena albidolilacea]